MFHNFSYFADFVLFWLPYWFIDNLNFLIANFSYFAPIHTQNAEFQGLRVSPNVLSCPISSLFSWKMSFSLSFTPCILVIRLFYDRHNSGFQQWLVDFWYATGFIYFLVSEMKTTFSQTV